MFYSNGDYIEFYTCQAFPENSGLSLIGISWGCNELAEADKTGVLARRAWANCYAFSIFYSSISGEKKVGNYTAGNSPPPPEENKFFTAPKGELYFAEAKARRSDRIYSIAIGIIVGICTAILAVKLGVK